jgi:hypothetical protein
MSASVEMRRLPSVHYSRSGGRLRPPGLAVCGPPVPGVKRQFIQIFISEAGSRHRAAFLLLLQKAVGHDLDIFAL